MIYSIQFLIINILGTDFLVVFTCIGAFVKESIDSFPMFNLGFCPECAMVIKRKFNFWSANHSKKREIFGGGLHILMNYWLYRDLFCFEKRMENGYYFVLVSAIRPTEILKAFSGFPAALHLGSYSPRSPAGKLVTHLSSIPHPH